MCPHTADLVSMQSFVVVIHEIRNRAYSEPHLLVGRAAEVSSLY